MNEFKQGAVVQSISVYGPANVEFKDEFWQMQITMEDGMYCRIPWVRAVHRRTGEVTMINCHKCACVKLKALDGEL